MVFGGAASISRTDSSSSGSSTESNSVRRLSADDEAFVRNLMRQFASASSNSTLEGAREQALMDVQGAVSEIFTNYRETSLPQIGGQVRRSGGYNSTTAQLLADNAFSRATAQASALTLDAVNQYETRALQRQSQAAQGLSSTLQALLGASETSQSSGSYSGRSSSTTMEAGVSYGLK